MHERREATYLPSWVEFLLTPEQRRTVRRRFGLPEADDPDVTVPRFPAGPDGGRGGGTPAPTSPSAPASLTRPADADEHG